MPQSAALQRALVATSHQAAAQVSQDASMMGSSVSYRLHWCFWSAYLYESWAQRVAWALSVPVHELL